MGAARGPLPPDVPRRLRQIHAPPKRPPRSGQPPPPLGQAGRLATRVLVRRRPLARGRGPPPAAAPLRAGPPRPGARRVPRRHARAVRRPSRVPRLAAALVVAPGRRRDAPPRIFGVPLPGLVAPVGPPQVAGRRREVAPQRLRDSRREVAGRTRPLQAVGPLRAASGPARRC